MKTPAVKGLFAAAAAVLFAATPLVGRSVTVDITKVQQRYPWNGLVDIDYVISLGANESPLTDADTLRFSITYKGATCVAKTFPREFSLAVGQHRATWDANADGYDFVAFGVEARLDLIRDVSEYLVIDVSKLNAQGGYDYEYYGEPPENGFNTDEYKGDKIVLRKIQPGSYTAGSPSGEPGRNDAREAQHPVTLTHSFYIGLFEVTQKQYKNVMGDNPSDKKNDYCPVSSTKYSVVRGGSWPTSENPGDNTFIKLIRIRTGLDKLDIPTEAQWEYACRAGTTTPFCTGVACSDTAAYAVEMAKVGWFDHASDGPTKVGSYDENAWGLYDMHGNVFEWCRDWYADKMGEKEVDPVGPSSSAQSARVRRGGSFAHAAEKCRSAFRAYHVATESLNQNGFRLSMDTDE